MTKLLTRMLCLKQQFHLFKMVESKFIVEKFTNIKKIINGLANIKVKFNDENKALLLLSLFPKSFEHFKDALLYGNESIITLEAVQSAIRTNEITIIKT